MGDELKEGTVFKFEDEEYVLYKLTEYMNSKYIVSLGYKNPKDVKIFEYKIEDGKVLIGLEVEVSHCDNNRLTRKWC